MNSMTTGLVVGMTMAALGVLIAAMRGGASTITMGKPRRLMSFVANESHLITFKTIAKYAQQSDYRIDAIDENSGRLVLSDSASLISFGFFYPIFLEKDKEGKTLVEIGIKSKLFQYGPLVSRSHERCFNAIKAALLSYT